MGVRLGACVLGIVAGCGSVNPFACTTSDQCVSGGLHGTCEPQGYCSLPDTTCPSGKRFEPNAGGGLGGTCAAAGMGSDGGVDGPVADAAPLGPITFIQTAATAYSGLAFGTLPLVTPAGVHHTIITCVNANLVATATMLVTDNAGNTYVPVLGPVTSGAQRFAIFAAFDIKNGASAVTVTLSAAATTTFEVYVHEYAGLRGFDVGTESTGMSSAVDAMTSGQVVTTMPHDLLFGYGVSGMVTSGTGFTQRSTFNSNVTEDRVVNTTGTYEATATMVAGTNWTMLMAAFAGQ